MKSHSYRLTLEHIADKEGAASGATTVVETTNHDELIGLIARIRAKGRDEEDVRLTLGLKLMTEVMLADRTNPLYADFMPHLGKLIGRLKAQSDNR